MAKFNLRFFHILLGILLITGIKATAQVVVTSSDSLNCGTTCTTLTAIVTGDVPINAGITVDDVYSTVHTIGFPFKYYGANYTQLVIAANGGINFNIADAGAYDPWPITAPLLGNASRFNQICGPWVDIDITAGSASGTITYSLLGAAPSRRYVLTYCAPNMFSCTAQRTTSQIILYETTNVIEVHIATKPVCAGWNSGRAIIGVQNATGTAATVAPGRDFPSVYTCTNEAWRFTPDAATGGASYAVASIPYATVPLASSLVYWYNVTTGAYLGTGSTMVVCPTAGTLYRAGARGCADTSFGYYFVSTSAAGPVVTPTATQPTMCGTCDGTITLSGLAAGLSDTVNYTLGGVPQPQIVAIVSGAGTITLSGLCPGVYNNFVVRQLSCSSLPAGPVTLAYPPISISSVTTNNPSMCGLCDGSLVLNGLYPSRTFTVNYSLGGVAQAPINTSTNAAGQITIGGLCAGTYSNIVASFGSCVTPPMGPYTLTNPPIAITSITRTNPSLCGVCDGSLVLNGLYANHIFTVTYNFNGVPASPVNTTSSAAGTITLNGLCNGIYTNIVAQFGACITPPAGPDTLFDPPIAITSVNTTDPTFCGVCDGTITLNGLYPNHDFVVNYNFNGVAQPAFVTISSATGTITLTGLCAGTYTNIIASFGDCITPAVGPHTLSNPPTPPLNVLSSTNPAQCGYCNGEVVIGNVTPFTVDTIRYSKDGTAAAPFVTVTQGDSSVHLTNLCAGNYTGFTISIGACLYTVNGSSNLTTIPVVSDFSYTVRPGCPKDTVTFHNLSTSTPGAAIWYVWDFGDGSSDTSANPTHIYTQGTYTVSLLATNHSCDSILKQQIILSHPLIAQFVDTPSVICQGRELEFVNTTVSATSTAAMQWLWTFGEPLPDVNMNGKHTFENMGVYTVTLVATDSIGCRDTAKHTVVVDTSGGIVMKATDTVICEGMFLTLEGLFSPVGNTGVTWDFGDNDQKVNLNPVQHAYNSPGTYTVTVNAIYRACETQTTQRNILVFPQPQVDLGRDTTICKGSTALQLVASTDGNPAIQYLWNTGQTSRVIQVSEPGQYYVKSVLAGCTTTDSIWVQDDCYMNMPNVFTPNGDGVNDYFFPRSMLTKGLTTFHMQIFNRWGNMLFETNLLDGRGWDGKYGNIDQPQGAYIYVIDGTFKDGQKEHHQGNVTLLR